MVVFTKTSIENLLKQDKLAKIFEQFEVSYILGYSPEISQKIIENSSVTNIADSSIKIKKEDIRMNNRNWFLNLVK